MCDDILEQSTTHLHNIDFDVQLGEATNASKMLHLLAFVRYMWEN